MDLSILKQKPVLNKKIKLIIQPLAPLSMVSDIPGTYYKTQSIPDMFKICGLFENILGWHLSVNDRDQINKELKKKEKGRILKESNSNYKPLLFDFFEINLVYSGKSIRYNDLWKKSFRRNDETVHPKGTPNLDFSLIKEKRELKRDSKKPMTVDNSALKIFFIENNNKFPTYYSSPTLREYIVFENDVELGLNIDESLLLILEKCLQECSTGYLGNSEGWIELKIERL
jgi:CRISPR-associated protein Cas5